MIEGRTFATVVQAPERGVVSFNSESGALEYTPLNPNQTGIDFVTVQITRPNLEATQVKLIIQTIAPEFIAAVESTPTTDKAPMPAPQLTEMAETVAQGALTFATSSSTSVQGGKGVTQIMVRADDAPVVPSDFHPANVDTTVELSSAAAHTVAAFAIQAEGDMSPADNFSEDDSHQNMVADALKELFEEKG